MEAVAEKQDMVVDNVHTTPAATVRAGANTGIFSLAYQAEQFERARFGWMAILLTIQSCIGALACMFISLRGSDVFMLSLCAALTMGSNALFIALASPRACLVGFYLSVAVNTALILANL